jgi:hypothetical protein
VQLSGDVNGQLMSLRTGQEHAVTQCMKELVVADPAFLFNGFVVKDGDMRGRAAKADPAQFPPEAQGFSEIRAHRGKRLAFDHFS